MSLVRSSMAAPVKSTLLGAIRILFPARSKGRLHDRRGQHKLLRNWPLKAQVISVRIANIELLHAIGRAFWLSHILGTRPKMSIRRIDVRATEVNRGIVVGGNPRAIRF